MKRAILMGSVAVCAALVLAATVQAAPPSATVVVAKPAASCIADVRAFSEQMQKTGDWLGGSDYGYGYPIGGFGYGRDYPMGGDPVASGTGYENLRPGYEVRTLLASANILGQNGQQAACETVLSSSRELYKRYSSEITGHGVSGGDGPGWQQQQIAGAQPVTSATASFRAGQLIDTAVLNSQDVALGSIHNIVISPTTGKIAYLIIGRGGLFGFDQTYIPVPWNDFKVSENMNLLVLDASKAVMSAAPAMSDAQLTRHGDFAQQSRKVDAYWQTALTAAK